MNDIEKKERVRKQNREAVKKYSEKTKTFALKYYATDIIDAKRLQLYLEQTGKSANEYLKEVVKRDLDEKGIEYNTGISDESIDNMDNE